MKAEVQSSMPGSTARARTIETFSDDNNKIISTQLSLDEFVANEDERMTALIQLYLDHSPDGRAPTIHAISPERIAMTGMMSRTHCLRVDQSTNTFRFAVWAEDANFDGFLSLQNATFEDLTKYSVMADALRSQLTIILDSGQLAFFEMKGVLNDRFYYFTKAILPLRSQQGEIVKCLVPFTDKLPDIPSDLREEFCLADMDEK